MLSYDTSDLSVFDSLCRSSDNHTHTQNRDALKINLNKYLMEVLSARRTTWNVPDLHIS